jgi:8-oxo-dGTP pyrophosphatase MutT (NUDIX family)
MDRGNDMSLSPRHFARLLVGVRRRLLSLSTVPRIGVRMLAVTPEDMVLLVRHTYAPGWHLPGGGVKTGETAVAGAKRETWEETGCSVGVVDGLLGLYANFGVGWSDHVAVYHTRELAIPADFPAKPPSSFEIAETGLFAIDDLPNDVSPCTVRRIEEWSGRRSVDLHW